MKVTTTAKAWLSKHSTMTPSQMQTPKGVAELDFFRPAANMAEHGFTYIGEAEITVDVPDERALIDNKVAALRAEAVAIRANATARATEIEGQIQQLLAIEHKPAAAEQQ